MSSPNQKSLETERGNVTLKTLVQYLFGYRSAILNLATNRATVWLGLIFVITAGLAREYDRENLAQEPWHLLAPLVASLATSWILFVMVYSVAIHRGAAMEGFWSTYRKFLGLYWMTAPLAWFYGIPVEKFLMPDDAVHANIGLLELVSWWRVILIVRVIVVLFNAWIVTVLPVVLLFADSVVLFLFATFPQPVISFMGGVRDSQGQVTVEMVTRYAGWFGILTYPFWALGFVLVFVSTEPEWVNVTATFKPSQRIQPTVWVLATASLVGWFILLMASNVFHFLAS